MKNPGTVRPDKAMTQTLKNVPGARFAKWSKISLSKSTDRAMALIPVDASGLGRDRLFFVGTGVAIEIILACPKCRKELYRIGAKRCHNCGFRIVPAQGERTRFRWLRSLSVVLVILGLAAHSFKDLSGMTPVILLISLFGLAASIAQADLPKVRLFYRFDADGAPRPYRLLKINSNAYTSPNIASFVGRILYSELSAMAAHKNDMMRLAQQASEHPARTVAPFDVAGRQTHEAGRGYDQLVACGAENPSQAFSLGNRDSQ